MLIFIDRPIREGNTKLHLEIVNENPNDPGVIGQGSLDLSPVLYQNQRLDDVWVPIYSAKNGGSSTVGHALIRLEKQSQQQHGGAAPPPPAYSGSFSSNEYPQEKQPQPPYYGQPDRQSSFASLGPEQPLPANYGSGNPPPFTPPATSSNNPPAYPSSPYSPQGSVSMPGNPSSPYSPQGSVSMPGNPSSPYSPQGSGAMPGNTGSPYPNTPQPGQTNDKEKEKSTDWMVSNPQAQCSGETN